MVAIVIQHSEHCSSRTTGKSLRMAENKFRSTCRSYHVRLQPNVITSFGIRSEDRHQIVWLGIGSSVWTLISKKVVDMGDPFHHSRRQTSNAGIPRYDYKIVDEPNKTIDEKPDMKPLTRRKAF